jgi:hypothetical protein
VFVGGRLARRMDHNATLIAAVQVALGLIIHFSLRATQT